MATGFWRSDHKLFHFLFIKNDFKCERNSNSKCICSLILWHSVRTPCKFKKELWGVSFPLWVVWQITESQNGRMVWVGRDLSRPSSQTPLQWPGTSSTGSGCSEPQPWTFPGRGHWQPLWATWARVSPPSIQGRIQWTICHVLYISFIYSFWLKLCLSELLQKKSIPWSRQRGHSLFNQRLL